MSNKFFNVVLNSFNCTTATQANANSNKSYYIDWSARMPQGVYHLSFTFQAEGNIIQNIPTVAVVYSDIVSSSSNMILPQSTVYSNTNILGTLYPTMIDPNGHVSYLRADQKSNPPIYLNNRPFNNEFIVQVQSNDLVPIPWVDETPTTPSPISAYILILQFELIREY
jgi:hypothetical protein